MSKEIVTNVSKLSKGDRLEPVPGVISNFPEKIVNKKGKTIPNSYIYIGVNKGSVTLRNPLGQLVSFTQAYFEDGYLYKIYKWTDWRTVPNDSNALYKTNRKRIWYKKGDVKVKVDCNTKYGDKFDLAYGLELCKKKWEEKVNMNNNKSIEEVKKHNFIINEVYGSVLNAPFYSKIAICINTDLKVRGYIGEFIDEKCKLNTILSTGYENYRSSYKAIDPNDINFAVVGNILCLVVSDPYCKATSTRLYRSLYEMAWYTLDKEIKYISMPKICCGSNGMEWNNVLEIMNTAFAEAYSNFSKQYTEPDGEVKITVYNN